MQGSADKLNGLYDELVGLKADAQIAGQAGRIPEEQLALDVGCCWNAVVLLPVCFSTCNKVAEDAREQVCGDQEAVAILIMVSVCVLRVI